MKMLFLKDVGGVAQRGAIKEVSDGYALNFLIPNGLAVQATPDRLAAHEKAEAAKSRESEAKDKEWQEIAKKLHGVRFQLIVKANEQGHLYKQLSAETIVEEIRRIYKIDVPREAVVISGPIKSLGEYESTVKFGKHAAKITLVVKA
jgi:large subunit ribosomal protein L9